MENQQQFDVKVRQQVANELGLYVYMLVDPSTGIPFYVGKGRGERFATHGASAMLLDGEGPEASSKIQTIRSIQAAGREPEIWIVRHGMKAQSEYTSVEAACIDLLRSMPVSAKPASTSRIPNGYPAQLTNARREASRGHGIMRLQDLYEEMAAPMLESESPLLIISLGDWVDVPDGERMPGGARKPGYGYKTEWLASSERVKHYQQIGESAASWFKYSEAEVDRRGIEHAVATHRGVTRALLEIVPGSWEHIGVGRERRSGFAFEPVREGLTFDEVIGQYGRRLPPKKRGEQSTFRYWPYV